MKIADREIGTGLPPYIVAELSGNHNGELSRAIRLLEEAKKAGADAVKLQTYTADTITLDHDGPEFLVDLPLWKGRKLYELYQEAFTPWDWHEALFKRAREIDITIFSSPFDHSAIDFLESLEAPAYKIASFENNDLPLIKKAAATGKPLIISTGMANREEISEALSAARSAGCQEVCLLHCVSAYPAPAEHTNLAHISAMRDDFGVLTGLSDHSLGNDVALASVALGAVFIEKHFTLDRSEGGVDSTFSLEPAELTDLVITSKKIWQAVGQADYQPTPSEKNSMKYRRSLFVVKDIAKGETFSPENVRSVRPASGLAPKHYETILGKKSAVDIKFGEPLSFDKVIMEE